MSTRSIDEERLNIEIRKFLKVVGITSQREIEKAVRDELASGSFPDTDRLQATVTLRVPSLDLEHEIEHEIFIDTVDD